MVLDQLMRMEKELNSDRQSMQQSIDAKQRLIEQQVPPSAPKIAPFRRFTFFRSFLEHVLIYFSLCESSS